MLCSFEKLLSALHGNADVELIDPIPQCPKHADIVCASQAGKCPVGNKKNCGQELSFYYQGAHLYNLTVTFTAFPNTRVGYIRDTDLQICRMLKKNIIQKSDLEELSE